MSERYVPVGDRTALEDILEGKYWNTNDGQSIGPSDLLPPLQKVETTGAE